MRSRMNVLRRKNLLVLLLVSFSFILYACGNGDVKEPNEGGEGNTSVSLSSGAVIVGENGTYKNYDLDDSGFKEVKTENTIVEYSEKTGNYIFIKEGKHFVKYGDEIVPIKEENYDFLNLSEDGKYVAYMVNDNGYKLKVLDLESKKDKFVQEKTSISGNLFDFIGEDKLVYYGIGSDKTNGIFTYDIKTSEEKLLYKLDGGYVEFLKGNKDGVIIFQQTLDNKKVLKEIDKEGNVKVLSNDVDKVRDIEKVDLNYYILGSFINDNNSIYQLKGDKTYSRLVYDFPKGVDLDRGLGRTKDGKVLFVGLNEYGKKSLFSYDKDGNVNLISDGKDDYTFVKIN